MNPIGYVLQQHSERLDRPVKAYRNWAERIPEAYSKSIIGDPSSSQVGSSPSPILQLDPYRLASLKNYRSLVPMGQEAHKPIFKLTSADGAIGSHNAAVQHAYQAFHNLANEILRRIT